VPHRTLGGLDFQALAETSPSLIFVADAQGQCLYTNSRFQTFTGLGPEALCGNSWLAAIHPDDRPRAFGAWQAAVLTAEPYQAECRFRAADGGFAWFLVHGAPVFEAGRVLHWIGNCCDIDDRKLAEENGTRASLARHINGLRLRRLVESGIVGIGFGCRDGSVSYVNDAFLRMIGRTRAELEAGLINWHELTAPEYHDLDDAAIAEMNRDGTCRPYEKEYILEDGSRLPIQVTMALLDPADAYTDHVAVILDISRQKAAENALRESTAELRRVNSRLVNEMRRLEEAQDALLQSQKLEALGQLTSGIAHDFNNMVTAIAGGFRMIERRTADPRLLDMARHGAKAAERAEALVRQLLGFARQQALSPKPTDLRAVFEEFEPLIRQTVGADIAVEVHCPADLGLVVVDPIQLEAAMINLAANARDAMQGGGRLSLHARACPSNEPERPAELKGAGAIAITIADTGGGMAPEVLQRVVEPYFTTKGPGKGTGLGLAMVHGFARQSGGALRMQSRLGQGTTIVIYLPRVTGNEAEIAAKPTLRPEQATEARPAGAATILLVDDDEHVRAVLAAELRELGYHVLQAEDGAAAVLLALRRDQHVDLILCDVVMPRTDGPAFVALIRQERPGLPVLFMTGHARRDYLDGEAVIQKPFLPGELATRLADLLGRRDTDSRASDEMLDRIAGRLRSGTLKLLFRRWRAVRSPARLPCLADFDINADGHVDRLAVIDVDMCRVPISFRLSSAGSALEAAGGHALAADISAFVGDNAPASQEASYTRCVRSGKPSYEYVRFGLGDGTPVLFERLLLPFSDSGASVTNLVAAVMITSGAADGQAMGRKV
jgi:PAS domain S-box-containing protein